MYTRLTKIVKDQDGRDCVTCVSFGTERCHIHNGIPDCARCPMLAAILNQLYGFEEIIIENHQNVIDDNLEQK